MSQGKTVVEFLVYGLFEERSVRKAFNRSSGERWLAYGTGWRVRDVVSVNVLQPDPSTLP